MVGLHSLAESMDPVSDEAVAVEVINWNDPKVIAELKNEINLKAERGEDIQELELILKAIDITASDNEHF